MLELVDIHQDGRVIKKVKRLSDSEILPLYRGQGGQLRYFPDLSTPSPSNSDPSAVEQNFVDIEDDDEINSFQLTLNKILPGSTFSVHHDLNDDVAALNDSPTGITRLIFNDQEMPSHVKQHLFQLIDDDHELAAQWYHT